MLILLTGGRGFIGNKLLFRLCKSGYKVRLVTRTPVDYKLEGLELVQADLTSIDTDFDSLLFGCSLVFNCAGEVRNEKLMHPLHVDATERLVAAANRLACQEHPIHFVQLSSVGAYGPSGGKVRVVTERTPTNPQGTYEETKTIADSLIMKDRNNDFYSYTILRPSNVFGRTMTNTSLRQLGRIVGRRLFFYIGTARKDAVATYVHVDDVVSALMLCGFKSGARNEIFNLSNDCALSELISGMADALQVTRPKWSIPEVPLRFLVSMMNRFFNLPITQTRIDALVARTTYSSAKLHEVLEFVPEKKVPTAIGELFLAEPAVK